MGALTLIEHDEVIRPETTIETLGGLRPVFDPVNGTVTAGTSFCIFRNMFKYSTILNLICSKW